MSRQDPVCLQMRQVPFVDVRDRKQQLKMDSLLHQDCAFLVFSELVLTYLQSLME